MSAPADPRPVGPGNPDAVVLMLENGAKMHPGFQWAYQHSIAAATIKALQDEIAFLRQML